MTERIAINFIRSLDPELASFLQALPGDSGLDWQDILSVRAAHDEMLAAMTADFRHSPGVVKDDCNVPGLEGAPEVRVRLYRPPDVADPVPCLVWIHGGGMVAGNMAMDDRLLQRVVQTVGCFAVSAEYRLAPENPFPAPLEDCYAVLRWAQMHGVGLGIDVSRIAVGGASAGGGLAAGLALLARDRNEVPIAFQWLIYPMLDDRNISPSSKAITDPRVVNREANLACWSAYLASEPGSDSISSYAAPARATNLSGLPPTYIQVGSQDLFVDEDTEYAQRLARVGVPVELHVYPGAFHASDLFVPAAALSQRMVIDRIEALKRGLGPEGVHAFRFEELAG